MKKVRKPSPTESPLLFEIDPEPLPEALTARGGVPLLVRTFRSLGLPARVREHVRIKERELRIGSPIFGRRTSRWRGWDW